MKKTKQATFIIDPTITLNKGDVLQLNNEADAKAGGGEFLGVVLGKKDGDHLMMIQTPELVSFMLRDKESDDMMLRNSNTLCAMLQWGLWERLKWAMTHVPESYEDE